MSKADSKHTPGPWAVTRKFEVGPISQADDQTNGMVIPIADVFGENRDADARLIAIAPDMLDLLKRISQSYPGYIPDFVEGIVKLIAKAEGRAQ